MDELIVTSRSNPRVKAIAALHRAKARREAGLTLAEGMHIAREALRDTARVETLVLRQGLVGEEAESLIALARERQAELLWLDESCFTKISDLNAPDGAAVVLRIETASMDALTQAADARLLVAAGVQDPGNAGALARTAEAAGASGCVFLGGVDPAHPRLLRASMGSALRLPCAAGDETDFLAIARHTNLRLMAADAGHAAEAESIDYRRIEYAPPVAICVGGEGAGIPPALAAAAQRVSIPMRPPVESLNVAVAAGVLLYRARESWIDDARTDAGARPC